MACARKRPVIRLRRVSATDDYVLPLKSSDSMTAIAGTRHSPSVHATDRCTSEPAGHSRSSRSRDLATCRRPVMATFSSRERGLPTHSRPSTLRKADFRFSSPGATSAASRRANSGGCGRRRVIAVQRVSVPQFVEQRLGFDEVQCVEPLRESTVDRREQVRRLISFSAFGPQSREVSCGAQLK